MELFCALTAEETGRSVELLVVVEEVVCLLVNVAFWSFLKRVNKFCLLNIYQKIQKITQSNSFLFDDPIIAIQFEIWLSFYKNIMMPIN